MKNNIRDSKLYKLLVKLFCWGRKNKKNEFSFKNLSMGKQDYIYSLLKCIKRDLRTGSDFGANGTMLYYMKLCANKALGILDDLS